MVFFSTFFVLLLAGVLAILWEFDHATRVHLGRRHRIAKPKHAGVIHNPGSKAA